MISAAQALERLREGNRRFVAALAGPTLPDGARRYELVEKQDPFAVILGCSDARVPPEIVFDAGLGELFVIRVAGNIVEPAHIGSAEFAVSKFGTKLVVVLGHSDCGAVRTTIDVLRSGTGAPSPNLGSIVDRVGPAVEPLIGDDQGDAALMQRAVEANVRSSVGQLIEGSEILQQRVRDDGLVVMGGAYSVETGTVAFFEDPATRSAE